MSYIYPFRMTSTTATLLLIDQNTNEIIIGVRSDNASAYPGADSLIGGFMEARFTENQESVMMRAARTGADKVLGMTLFTEEYHEGETVEECAVREAKEEMSVDLTLDQLKLFAVHSGPRTDTRAHVTNVCFYAVLTPEQIRQLVPGDDIQGFKRMTIENLDLNIPMAFNHSLIMMEGVAAYQQDMRVKQLESEIARLRERNNELSWANEPRQGGI